MMMLIIIMISPIVVPNFRLKKMARTSVPSITAPPLIDKPIPAPRKNPPKIATSKLSLVILGNCNNAKHMASPVIAKAVLKANCLPMVTYPKMIKGMFTPMMYIYSGMFVNRESNKEIPVAPPSINLFVKRNPLKPNDAEKTPAVISKTSLILLFIEMISSRYPFAS